MHQPWLMVHHQLTLWHCVERAPGYAASFLEGGFGFIQYFTHPNHQTVHDRIAETIVVICAAPRASAPGARWNDQRALDLAQCAAAVAAPMPVSERTCCARNPARSSPARGLRSRIEKSQMPTKPIVIENSAGDA